MLTSLLNPYTPTILEEIATIYKTTGIVTRNEVSSIDSRAFIENLREELLKYDIDNASLAYQQTTFDYSYALFNPNLFDHQEAKEYLKTHVLKG
ncbi:hypothetical protein [Turicibacter sanguinis]|uniref:hypothetical protein n=1 Tax=Turicibacter sanguinis TaxID=154288 RepID=UPI0018A992D9|nr:hypothetical protein [Turicibacter sanguinis]MDB8553023.1 hypothetical protein [Turicibacter sanguinis]